MANSEYKLNYSGEEINRKLSKIDSLLPQRDGRAIGLQIDTNGILYKDSAVNVNWVEQKLTTGYLSLSGNSKERPIKNDLYLAQNSKILNTNYARALFTYDLAN